MKIHQVAKTTRMESALGERIEPCFIKPPVELKVQIKSFETTQSSLVLTVNVPDTLSNVVVGFTGVFAEPMVHPDNAPNYGSSDNEREEDEVPNNLIERS